MDLYEGNQACIYWFTTYGNREENVSLQKTET